MPSHALCREIAAELGAGPRLRSRLPQIAELPVALAMATRPADAVIEGNRMARPRLGPGQRRYGFRPAASCSHSSACARARRAALRARSAARRSSAASSFRPASSYLSACSSASAALVSSASADRLRTDDRWSALTRVCLSAGSPALAGRSAAPSSIASVMMAPPQPPLEHESVLRR